MDDAHVSAETCTRDDVAFPEAVLVDPDAGAAVRVTLSAPSVDNAASQVPRTTVPSRPLRHVGKMLSKKATSRKSAA